MSNKFNKPAVYAVATSHLDTVWNWDFETTIREYIYNTLADNFALIKKYPNYVFNFEGSYRYELMEEYYPELFKKLKDYIAKGRWCVTGSAYENGDVNVPSPEALFRNILYGNDYFAKTFGKRSKDIFLPDCFGFGTQLPTIAAHANLNGFTTQKLTWSSSVGIPFDLGRWQGIDGKEIFASLNALSYVGRPKKFRKHRKAKKKLKENMSQFGLPATYLFYGTGDIGGAPKEYCVAALEKEIAKNDKKPVNVISSPADQVFRDFENNLTPDKKSALPLFKGELLSTNHGVGCYTSRTVGKRWNKRGEWLADAAERFAVAAMWLGAAGYPKKELDTAWKRIIAGQFHDDLTGTSLARVYQRSWNHYSLSLNQLAQLYTAAVSAIRAQMDDSFVEGQCITVANPTAYERNETVTATAQLNSENVKVLDSKGRELPSQVISRDGNKLTVAFSASVPANGIALFDLQGSELEYIGQTGLSVAKDRLENNRLRVKIDQNGDICEIFDKVNNRQILSKPIRMCIHKYHGDKEYPAWELRYDEVMADPVAYAANPAVEIAADGAARVALKITRTAEGSTFVQTLSLDVSSEVLCVENDIDWQTKCRLLKTNFNLCVANEMANYDVGVGVAQRGVNTEKLYEVPAQNFADISANDYGVSILSDCRYGWDHPDRSTLRLTGIHTPRLPFRPDSYQDQLDFGRNLYAFGVFGHSGKSLESSQRAALCFNQPLQAFTQPASAKNINAALPGVWGYGTLSDPGVALRCVKKAENSDEIVVRVQEIAGQAHHKVRLKLMGNAVKVREMWASEEAIENSVGGVAIENGEIIFDLAKFQPKTFGVVLEQSKTAVKTLGSMDIAFEGDTAVTSSQKAPKNGVIVCVDKVQFKLAGTDDKLTSNQGQGMTIPEELYPERVVSGGVSHKFSKKALACNGQTLALPKGTSSVDLLLTSTKGDKEAVFALGGDFVTQTVQSATERIGKWDLPAMGDTAQVKTGKLAWNATHMHNAKGDVFAQHAYIYRHSFQVPDGAASLTLPKDSELLLFAATAVEGLRLTEDMDVV